MWNIEFRGLCEKSKEMVFGDLIHGVDYKKGNLYILPNKSNLAYVKYCDPLDGVRVISETVGVFTSHVTKKGNKIYSGDIVKIGGLIEIVCYINGVLCCFSENIYGKIEFLDVDESESLIVSSYDYFDNYDVIGNIYQNPELCE